MLAFLAASAPAFAQAGSVGGTIGQTDKSVSGGQAAPAQPSQGYPRKPRLSAIRPVSAPAHKAEAPACRLAGVWTWSTGGEAVIKPGGALTKGPLTATWTCKNNLAVLIWSHGFTDHLTLSPDAASLSGSNNLGFPITATRKEGE
jgi:hypothetical protein